MLKYNIALDGRNNVVRVNWISKNDAGCSYLTINGRYASAESNVLLVDELHDLTEEELKKIDLKLLAWVITLSKDKEEIVLDSQGDWKRKFLRNSVNT